MESSGADSDVTSPKFATGRALRLYVPGTAPRQNDWLADQLDVAEQMHPHVGRLPASDTSRSHHCGTMRRVMSRRRKFGDACWIAESGCRQRHRPADLDHQQRNLMASIQDDSVQSAPRTRFVGSRTVFTGHESLWSGALVVCVCQFLTGEALETSHSTMSPMHAPAAGA